MSERFVRLFTAESNLHVDGSPVIIKAGALLKDTVTAKIIAQLKFLNLSGKTISYLRVYICPLDAMNHRMCEAIPYEYLDISIPPCKEFGSKQPLFMPNASTRAFEIFGCDVRFKDGTSWSCKNSSWNSDADEVKYSKEVIEIYKKASVLCNSNDKSDLIRAIRLFNKIKDHQPVEDEIRRCQERLRNLIDAEIVGTYSKASELCNSNDKSDLIRAIQLFNKIKDHQPVEDEIRRCQERLRNLIDAETVETYSKASELCNSNDKSDLIRAIQLFNKIKDRRPVEDEIRRCQERLGNSIDAETGETYIKASALCKSNDKYELLSALRLFYKIKDLHPVEEEIQLCEEKLRTIKEREARETKKRDINHKILFIVFAAVALLLLLFVLLPLLSQMLA